MHKLRSGNDGGRYRSYDLVCLFSLRDRNVLVGFGRIRMHKLQRRDLRELDRHLELHKLRSRNHVDRYWGFDLVSLLSLRHGYLLVGFGRIGLHSLSFWKLLFERQCELLPDWSILGGLRHGMLKLLSRPVHVSAR